MSVNSAQLFLFTCAIEMTLLALVAQAIFRPISMLLMTLASGAFLWAIAWRMIPSDPLIVEWLNWLANNPQFWWAVVALIWITTVTIRSSTFASTVGRDDEGQVS